MHGSNNPANIYALAENLIFETKLGPHFSKMKLGTAYDYIKDICDLLPQNERKVAHLYTER